MTIYLLDANGKRKRINLDPATATPLGGGGAGTIFQDPNDPTMAFKIYKDTATALLHRDKVQAMLNSPPDDQIVIVDGRRYVQLAWPRAVIQTGGGEFAGFSMPLVKIAETESGSAIVQHRARQRAMLRDDYPFRLTVARNLASVIRELHRRKHYIVDLHAGNFKLYRQDGVVCLLDTDGFSIAGQGSARYPAEFVLNDIVCPEGQGWPHQDLGQQQDLFALAVLIFQLLNDGLHPFQGVPRPGRQVPPDLVSRIVGRLYAYGQIPCPDQAPSQYSLHKWLEDDTLALFDQAFASGPPRPEARQWRVHLDNLNKTLLVQCSADPSHWHFSKGCMWCDKARRWPIASGTRARQVAARPVTAPPQQPQTQVQARPRANARRAVAWFGGAGACLLLILLALNWGMTVKSIRQKDDSAWRTAQSQGSIEGYRSYLAQNPSGNYHDDAQLRVRQLDDTSWKGAVAADTPEAYRNYLRTPDAGHGEEATRALERASQRELEDESAWRTAQSKNANESYRSYLEHNPLGHHRDDAQLRVRQLDDTNWKGAVAADTPEAYRNYLRTPDAGHGEEATRALARASQREQADENAWRAAQSHGAIEGYRSYLENNPLGHHRDDALLRVRQLDDTNWKGAVAADTPEAYRNYLRTPDAGYGEEATRALARASQREQADESAWRTAQSQGSIEGYRSYLENSPLGHHRDDAQLRVRQLDDMNWKSAVAADTPEAYRNYLRTPEAGHGEEATRALTRASQKETGQLGAAGNRGRIPGPATLPGASFLPRPPPLGDPNGLVMCKLPNVSQPQPMSLARCHSYVGVLVDD